MNTNAITLRKCNIGLDFPRASEMTNSRIAYAISGQGVRRGGERVEEGLDEDRRGASSIRPDTKGLSTAAPAANESGTDGNARQRFGIAQMACRRN
ncbi:hypothetical protein Trydic_g21200 [Trypoxylus dichotomus]